MSTEIRSSISARLKEEREKLRLSQTEMAERGGTKMRTYQDWERGLSGVNAEFLAEVAGIGIDVLYVLTGVRAFRASANLNADESALICLYKGLNERDQHTVRAVVRAFAELEAIRPTLTSSSSGQVSLPGELVFPSSQKRLEA